MEGSGLFPQTRHSILDRLKNPEPGHRQQAFAVLAGGYWRPVYKYLRLRWNLPAEDARDLTQEFFLAAWQGETFRSYSPAKARFRTFLRVCLDRMVINHRKAAGRLKRGGSSPVVALDTESAETELRLSPTAANDPEEFFYREWVRGLIAQAIDDLEKICAECGKSLQFQIFLEHDSVDSADRPGYRELAERHGIPVTQVTNHLNWARRRFRDEVKRLLRELTFSEEEFHAELDRLLGGA